MMRSTFLTLLVAIGLMTPALAGVVFEIERKDLSESPPRIENAVTRIEGRSLRIDTEYVGGQGQRSSLIYRGDRQVMFAIDHDSRQVMEIDKDSLRQLGSQMSQAMKEMEKQMANLPPEQREMVEQMMKGNMPAMPPGGAGGQTPKSAIDVRKTADQGTSHGYPWVKYEVFKEGQKVREYLVTNWGNMGLEKESFDLFSEMSEFFREFTDSLGSVIPVDNPFEEMDELDGFPVVARDFENGTLAAESVLKTVRPAVIDPSQFEAPEGYSRPEMGGVGP
jgi:hypothetical protein